MAPPHGPLHPHARFTLADVLAIRQAHSRGTGIRALARAYRVNPTTIHRLVHNRTYPPTDPDPTPLGLSGVLPSAPHKGE